MKLSHYVKVYPDTNNPGQLILFSTKKASLIQIMQEVFDSIENGGLSEEDEATLRKLAMVVDDHETEKKEVCDFIDRFNELSEYVHTTFILNLDCNFDCIYCHEGKMKGKYYMTEETAEQTIDFVKKQFVGKKKSLHIDFYGGEPLLSLDLMRKIAIEMKSFMDDMGGKFTFNFATNGSLLKREVVRDLRQFGLRIFRVTLDGPKDIHDKYRPFKSGAPTYDTIIGNLKEVMKDMKVFIGGNYDEKTWKRFPELLDDMIKEGLTPDKVQSIRFGGVMNRYEGDISPADYNDGCLTSDEPWMSDAMELLKEEIMKRGFNTDKPKPGPCVVEFRDSFIVNYDGLIYKCPALNGKKRFCIGHVNTGVEDYSKAYGMNRWKNEECMECEYLPICFGGCRYMSFVKNGHLNEMDCKRDFLERSLEVLIKQDVKYRHELGIVPKE